jgi:hypothetical protein
MINKKSLYEILVKYDGHRDMTEFCDSLSKVIQNKYTDADIISIIANIDFLDSQEIESIDKNVGIFEVIF